MAPTPFVQLASALVEAMGQRLDAARPIPEGLVLRTGDGFQFAFLEDPNRVSLETIRHLFEEDERRPLHFVVLTPGHLPLAISQDVVRRGGTLVEGARFAELARQLGLEAYLGEEPRAAVPHPPRRLLPSAQQLDEILQRARTWLDWGVPALALRFYRQAADLKPEFLPAKSGIGRALLALGLVADADRTFDEVLATHPDDLDARIGKAAVLGARAEPQKEVELYRTLLAEDDARAEVRAHLVAALIDLGDWSGARTEIESLLSRTPEDPQLRFLHAVALSATGSKELGEEERIEARRLGLRYDREVALCRHLHLPDPPRPEAPAPPPEPVRAVPSGSGGGRSSVPPKVSNRSGGSPRTTSRGSAAKRRKRPGAGPRGRRAATRKSK